MAVLAQKVKSCNNCKWFMEDTAIGSTHFCNFHKDFIMFDGCNDGSGGVCGKYEKLETKKTLKEKINEILLTYMREDTMFEYGLETFADEIITIIKGEMNAR